MGWMFLLNASRISPLQLPARSLGDKNNHCKYLNTHCRGLAADCVRKRWWYVVMALNILALSHMEAAPVHLLAAVQSWNWWWFTLVGAEFAQMQEWKARTSHEVPHPAARWLWPPSTCSEGHTCFREILCNDNVPCYDWPNFLVGDSTLFCRKNDPSLEHIPVTSSPLKITIKWAETLD